jgi:hypothetical protein
MKNKICHTVDSGQQTVAIRQWPSDSGQQTVANRQWPSDSGQQTVAIRQWPTDSGQQTVANRQWPTDSGHQTVAIRQWPTVDISNTALHDHSLSVETKYLDWQDQRPAPASSQIHSYSHPTCHVWLWKYDFPAYTHLSNKKKNIQIAEIILDYIIYFQTGSLFSKDIRACKCFLHVNKKLIPSHINRSAVL